MSANEAHAVKRITRLCQIYGLNPEAFRHKPEDWFMHDVISPILMNQTRSRVERQEPSIWIGMHTLPDRPHRVRIRSLDEFSGASRKLPVEREPDEYWFRKGSDLAGRGIDSLPSQRWK